MRLFALFFIFAVIIACDAKKEMHPPTNVVVDPELAIRQLLQQGEYEAAATAYLKRAEQNPQHAALYRLRAVAAYIDAAALVTAKTVLDATAVDDNDALLLLRQQLLYAKLALEQNQPALSYLQQPPAHDTPVSLLRIWYMLYAAANTQAQRYVEAAQARVTLADYLHDSAARRENVYAIWQGIDAVSLTELEEHCINASAKFARWCELGVLYKQMRYDTKRLRYLLDGWSERYPGHLATELIIPALLDQSRQLTKRPGHIALLLPFNDQYLKVSEAIRDGLIAAWYADQAQRPRISIYDTNALDMQTLYQQLIDAGADFIIGPLEKEKIKTLSRYANGEQSILSLNNIVDDTVLGDVKLVQFALSPEDEVEQVVERAWLDGHMLALAITPDTRWGERIYAAFESAWEKRGGTLLEHQRFTDESAQNYAVPIKRILNVDSSALRKNILEDTVGLRLISADRIREDADFIFLAARPAAARQLMPQLRFFADDALPVYSVSDIYSGVNGGHQDEDMNGIYFVDMPWVLDSKRSLSLMQDRLNTIWRIDQSDYRRFYAFGIDAYRLVPELARLSNERDAFFNGETGDLFLTEQGKIKRRLYWAQFVHGRPVLVD